MKKWLGRIGIVFGVLVLLLIGSWVWIWTAPPPALEVGPDTTVIEQPLRDDGTVDYIAALNQRFSEGVTPENNAFVIIAQLMPPDEWDAAALREKVFDQLGVAVPDEDAAYFEPFAEYARQRTIDEAGGGSRSLMFPPGDLPWDTEQERAMAEPWSRDDAPLVADWLDEQETQLDAIVEATQRSHYWSPYASESNTVVLFDILLPHLATLHGLSEALHMRVMHRLHEQDVDGAIEDVLAIKRLARHQSSTGTFIERFSGFHFAEQGAHALAAVLSHGSLTAGHIRDLRREIQSMRIALDMTAAMEVERYVLLDLLQKPSHANSDNLASLFAGSGLVNVQGLDFSSLGERIDPNQALRRANGYFDRAADAVNASTRAERINRLKAIEDEIEQNAGEAAEPSLRWVAAVAGNRAALTGLYTDILLSVLQPLGSRAATRADYAEIPNRLEAVALALAGYRAEHGQYPAALEDLTPDWLEEVPVDLVDPDEAPLRYRVDDDRVLIYSVGLNGEDDDGHAWDGTANVEQGDDLALELPRPQPPTTGQP